MSHYKRENIKSQKPKEMTYTCNHIQECDVHLIVMLTEVSGASKVDKSSYFYFT